MKTIGENVRRFRENLGLSQEELAQAAKTTQSTIDRIERDEVSNSRFLPRIAGVLRVSLPELDESFGENLSYMKHHDLLPVSKLWEARTFPVYSSVQGGPGEIIRSPDPIDWWPRPIEVLRVKDAYGLYVVGTSMVPEFEQGHVAVINPNLPLMAEKPYIFFGETEEGTVRATLKRLKRQTDQSWHVLQHNPPAGQKQEFTLPRKIWKVAHRIVGRQDPS